MACNILDDSEMENLLKMTNNLMSKLKKQMI
jgi:hypothetical protein